MTFEKIRNLFQSQSTQQPTIVDSTTNIELSINKKLFWIIPIIFLASVALTLFLIVICKRNRIVTKKEKEVVKMDAMAVMVLVVVHHLLGSTSIHSEIFIPQNQILNIAYNVTFIL
jgi:hypothetical protein